MPVTRKARHACLRPRGFTLLELLLALVISSVLAGVLYASLAIAFNAREAAHEELGATAAGRTALDVVRADLAGVQPPTGILAGAIMGTDATGPNGQPADELTYVTNNPMMPTGQELADLKSITLRLVNTSDRAADERDAGRQLVREINTNLLAQTEPAHHRQVLAQRIASMNIRYYDGDAWHDSWDSAEQGDTQPSAVTIMLEIVPTDASPETSSDNGQLTTVRRTFSLLMSPTHTQRQTQERF